ncbi:hypothetical protein [Cupriavidus sp. UYPR2.512]|uniref:hypothetical protein n=1 Tax=Cupriavidus sp. UYPR2.512 TaxID=1080187 RepID=UPI00036248FB|nr:hypothetical protein [Cupriavidus sp. UYPR2.512]UIF89097.1 hypothetical protein KAF44_28540 [Cupriavidus necator]
MFRETLFMWEHARKAALLAGDISAGRASQEKMTRTFQTSGLPNKPGYIPDQIQQAHLSPAIIRKIALTNTTEIEDRVTEADFEELKAFVGNLFGVDLSKTTLLRVSSQFLRKWNTSAEDPEAKAVSCGTDEHLVLLPDGFQSLDLVAHELGHAAEFTMRRQLGTDWGLVNRAIVSETTAHYAQFHQLLAHGSRNRRSGALGAFLFPFFAAQFIFAASEQPRYDGEMLEHPRFAPFWDAHCYTRPQLEGLLGLFSGRSIGEIYMVPVETRFSIPLALKLLGRPDDMKRLIVANIDRPLAEILDSIDIDPAELLDFTDLDSLFEGFISGSLH